MSNSVRPYGQQATRVLCAWDSLGKNIGVDCHFLLHIEQWTRSKLGREYVKAVYCHPAYLHHVKFWARWLTSWSQDFWEKYQQPQICRWYQPYGRKWRGTKEPLDKGERRVLKSWLKIQHSRNQDHGFWSHHFMANRWGKSGSSCQFSFLGPQSFCGWWLQPWN